MGSISQETLKAGKMLEVDKLSADAKKSPVFEKFSNWVKDCSDLDAGSIGGSGLDLSCGRYLKLEEQTPIDEAVIAALRNKETTYWDHCPELPGTLAAKLQIENGLTVDPRTELCITCGITPAVDTVLSAFVNPGDEVISMDPDFVTTYGQIRSRGAVLVTAPAFREQKGVLDESRWVFQPERLEAAITEKTKLIVYTNPNNPMGYVYSQKDLEAIADIAVRHNLIVLENQCYERIVHDPVFYQTLRFHSLAEQPGMRERTVTFGGVSKGFHLSGYRIGWIIAAPEMIQTFQFVQMWSTFTTSPTITEYGVDAALRSPLREKYARASLDVYRQNIDCLCGALKEIPEVECARPMGGPFCFMDVTNTGYDDRTLAHMLYDRGVGTSFGCGWGPRNGRNHIRLALSNPPEYEQKCAQSLVDALKDILHRR